MYSSASQIALRMLTYGEKPADEGADSPPHRIRHRLPRVARHRRDGVPPGARRGRLASVADRRSVWRLSRRADACPRGWIVCCRPSSRRLNDLLHPRGILARNDPRTRLLEGLEQRVEVLVGRGAGHGRRHRRRRRVRRRPAQGPEDRACFSISARTARRPPGTRAGACSIASAITAGSRIALGRRCEETIAIDVSEDAIARLRANAGRNGVAVDARVGNVFDELRGLERLRERFDTIVLDPPAFAKNKASVAKARVGLQGNQPSRAEAAQSGRHARDLQLLVQRQRGRVRRTGLRGGGRRAGPRRRSSRSACRAAIIRCCSACRRPTT